MPRAKPSGVGSARIAMSSDEHLRVRQQPRRDDRPARPQVLVDLQRRVRAGAARRHEHVGGVEIRRNLLGRPLAGEDRRRRRPAPRACACARARPDRACRRRARAARPAAREHERHRLEQQVESLVRLERAGVQHDRRRRRRARALRGSPRRCPSTGASPDPGAFSISTVRASGSTCRARSPRGADRSR